MLFFHKKQNKIERESLRGLVDYHSHILPAVDDGVRSLEESLEILSIYEDMGVEGLWLTPHIMEDMPNTTSELREYFEQFQNSYKGSVKLHLSAENMIDELFEERLEANDFLPYGLKGDELLVETSYFTAPMRFYEIIEEIKHKGYYPVLAHPERYMYMNEDDYTKLQSFGVRFQLNLFSTIGLYGSNAQKRAKYLLDRSMYNYKGSDLHSIRVIDKCIK